MHVARTNGNLTVDLKNSFYTKGAANLNQALAIASAVLPNSVAIANLQTTCTSLQNQINALEATVLETIAARNVLAARVTVLENSYATQSDVSALQSRCGDLETWADALDGVLHSGGSPLLRAARSFRKASGDGETYRET